MVAPSVLGTDLVERWRDIGPALWLAAGALLALWLVVAHLPDRDEAGHDAVTAAVAGVTPAAVG